MACFLRASPKFTTQWCSSFAAAPRNERPSKGRSKGNRYFRSFAALWTLWRVGLVRLWPGGEANVKLCLCSRPHLRPHSRINPRKLAGRQTSSGIIAHSGLPEVGGSNPPGPSPAVCRWLFPGGQPIARDVLARDARAPQPLSRLVLTAVIFRPSIEKGHVMRWVHLAVIALFAIATVLSPFRILRDRHHVVSRLQRPRAVGAAGRDRLRHRHGDGRQPVGAAAPVVAGVAAYEDAIASAGSAALARRSQSRQGCPRQTAMASACHCTG